MYSHILITVVECGGAKVRSAPCNQRVGGSNSSQVTAKCII